MTPDQSAALRQRFPEEAIGKLPKGGKLLDFVGHASVTDRLLDVDPEWTWEPLAFAANGTPLWTVDAGNAVMWIRLTVAGVSRLGVGIVKDNTDDLEKKLISDALKNAAMRFGVALSLWSKEDLHASENADAAGDTAARPSASATHAGVAREIDEPRVPKADIQGRPKTTPAESGSPRSRPRAESDAAEVSPPKPTETSAAPSPDEWKPPAVQLHNAIALRRALYARGISIYEVMKQEGIPKLEDVHDEPTFQLWQKILADLDTANPEQVNT
jgi:hypothetical protein